MRSNERHASRHAHTPVTGTPRSITATRMPAISTTQRQALLALLDEGPDHSLNEALDRYHSEHLLVDGLAASTVEWRERSITELRRWGRRSVRDTYRDVAAQLYAEARAKGRGESIPSMRCNTLARVLNLAKGWGWRTDEHDLKGLCRIRSKKRTGYLTQEHLAAIARGLEKLDERPRLHVASECVRLVLFTGWRASEAAGVEWRYVDPARSVVHLPKTKRQEARNAVANRWALEVIQRQPRTCAWVFPRRRGDGPIHRRQVLEALVMACECSDAPRTAVHFLRNHFCSTAAQLDLPTRSVAEAMGHSEEHQTSAYQGVRHDDVLRVVERIGGEIRKAVGS
jgi:integrase